MFAGTACAELPGAQRVGASRHVGTGTHLRPAWPRELHLRRRVRQRPGHQRQVSYKGSYKQTVLLEAHKQVTWYNS